MWDWFCDRYKIEIICADTTKFLNCVNQKKVNLYSVEAVNSLKMQFSVTGRDMRNVVAIADKLGAEFKIISRSGIFLTVYSLINRPVLTIFAVFLLALTIFLPSKVLFVSVEGNATVPTKLILETAADCGLGFGSNRRQVRSEAIKNKLLEKIPQLQWAGINTHGCTAVISVQEKSLQEPLTDNSKKVSSIVALRDGVIQNCTVYQGNSLCTVGQAVKAGQMLVSGYLDCGLVIKATQADAEIKAFTSRKILAVAPNAECVRTGVIAKKSKYSLIIGKKLIKLQNDSGNLDAICGKMYSEEYLMLPGGFRLPVAVVKETYLYYTDDCQAQMTADDSLWLSEFAKKYLQSTMIAGEILFSEDSVKIKENTAILHGRYACLEMIGQVKFEQSIEKDDNE